MLERLQAIAVRFNRLRPFLLVLAVCGLSLGLYVLLTSSDQGDDVALIPAFMLFTWATMARSFVTIFAHVPVKADKDAGFWKRFKLGAQRAVYYGFMALFAVATIFLLLSSWQLSSVWRMMY